MPNMDILLVIFGAIMAYLIGSLPTSVWLGEAYFGIDVRKYGSGNAGATNTFRVLGKRAGIIVMLVDTFKGWTATSLASRKKKGVRECVVNKHVVLYYKLNADVIEIIAIQDSRRNRLINLTYVECQCSFNSTNLNF